MTSAASIVKKEWLLAHAPTVLAGLLAETGEWASDAVVVRYAVKLAEALYGEIEKREEAGAPLTSIAEGSPVYTQLVNRPATRSLVGYHARSTDPIDEVARAFGLFNRLVAGRWKVLNGKMSCLLVVVKDSP